MSSTILILVSMTTLAMLCDNALAALPARCNPGYLDDLPPRVRKVCAALSRMYEFGSEMESYIDERESHIPGTDSCRVRSSGMTNVLKHSDQSRGPNLFE